MFLAQVLWFLNDGRGNPGENKEQRWYQMAGDTYHIRKTKILLNSYLAHLLLYKYK